MHRDLRIAFLEGGAGTFAGALPTILKVNSANSLARAKEGPTQAITGSVRDALRLGCSAIGYTIYPGSDLAFDMMSDIAEMAREAKANGLAVVIWSYPRGGSMSKQGETAIDITAYAAHMAALLGAHIIKVKPPTSYIAQPEARAAYPDSAGYEQLQQRIAHVVQAAFNGRKLVIFSGGAARTDSDILAEVLAIHRGGGHGSIIGRNAFQRPRAQALKLLNLIIDIHLGRD